MIILVIIIVVVLVLVAGAVYINLVIRQWDKPERFEIEYPASGKRVACVGDSITMGQITRDSYPLKLGELLGDSFVVENFGLGGATALQCGDRPYRKFNAYQYSLRFNPDIILIKFGVNDSKRNNWKRSQFIHDYKELIEGYINLPEQPRVIVISPTPVFSTNFKVQSRVIQEEIITDVRIICRELGIEYVDINSIFRDKGELFPKDGIHPNEEGINLIAEKLYELIEWN